jgi:hypothetical protein
MADGSRLIISEELRKLADRVDAMGDNVGGAMFAIYGDACYGAILDKYVGKTNHNAFLRECVKAFLDSMEEYRELN